nr:reverse transcriptase domain-containing protein [Tanacetum cinerariifolium]
MMTRWCTAVGGVGGSVVRMAAGVVVLALGRRRLLEKWRRVTESDVGDRIDRVTGNIFWGSPETLAGKVFRRRRCGGCRPEVVVAGELKEKSVDEKEVLTVVEEERRTWMTPIHEYLVEGILPKERKKARAIRRKARRYAATDGVLYKKSFLGPWLRCVGPLQANYVLREIHEGSCSMHAGPRECKDCQVHRPMLRNPQQNLTPITSPWPFYKWGIDIVGPFPEGPGKVKFLIVAIDYFTKWIEAKPVATTIGARIKKDNPFKDWCVKLCIRQCFAFVKHPQANGLVERANRSLCEGIKARLDKRRKNWLEEISHVLWAHRTMIKSSNGETPFSLMYGAKAVIPVEIGMPTLRTTEVDVIKNDKALRVILDLLEEKKKNRKQFRKQKAKPGWRNTITPGFVTQASVRETSSTGTMKQAVRKMGASSNLSEKDHMKSPFREHGTSATLKNVICTKCKYLSRTE